MALLEIYPCGFVPGTTYPTQDAGGGFPGGELRQGVHALPEAPPLGQLRHAAAVTQAPRRTPARQAQLLCEFDYHWSSFGVSFSYNFSIHFLLQVMTRYISNPDNLKLMMNMLKEKSRNIQFEAFHVFKVSRESFDPTYHLLHTLAYIIYFIPLHTIHTYEL